mmetsp:Transcript_5886/g.12049  ORF Transcript_5886/g.12049 Transcript_5886/m.12049 type:complete len:115 (+) Transcript_5886:241-585(+)
MTVIEAEGGAVAVGAFRQVGEDQELTETDYEQRTPRQDQMHRLGESRSLPSWSIQNVCCTCNISIIPSQRRGLPGDRQNPQSRFYALQAESSHHLMEVIDSLLHFLCRLHSFER